MKPIACNSITEGGCIVYPRGPTLFGSSLTSLAPHFLICLGTGAIIFTLLMVFKRTKHLETIPTSLIVIISILSVLIPFILLALFNPRGFY